MTTLNINGRRVTVDDSFLSLSPEQQEATVNEIAGQIGATQADPRDSFVGKADAAVRGAADMLSLGFADEIAAGLGTGFGMLGDYDAELARQRGIDQSDTENRFGYRLGGQLAGGVAGGVGLSNAGLSLATRTAQGGGSLARLAGGAAADGALTGGAYGFGSGEGAEGRLHGAGLGAAVGGVAGAAAPYAMAGLQAAASPVVRPIMSRVRPEAYASRALSDGLGRAGMGVDDVVAALARASDDGQPMYTVADAMGNAGQRMLSTVARTPNNARQDVIEALANRQMGQGERLTNFLAEGFSAPDTAAQRVAGLKGARKAAADTAYEAARKGAGAVDVSGAVAAADDILSPGVSRVANPGSGIADDSLEGVIRRARSLLTDGRSNLSNFDSVLRAKQDIRDMIDAAVRSGRNNQARLLSRVHDELDSALEAASPAYRSANDDFARASRVIDTVDTGTAAASGRTRASDNIAQFQQMTPEQQAAFRVGYADPLIARVESAAASPTTNRARMLITDKTGQEFPAFAAPGQADQLGQRIAREQRMFETANAALGGSKTADNLADMAEAAKFDPSILANLLAGRPVAAAMDAVGGLLREARGQSPGVTERIARALIATDADAARQVLSASREVTAQDDVLRALVSSILGQQGGAQAGRAKPLQITVTPR